MNFFDENGNPVAAPEGVDPGQFVQGGGRVAMVRPDGTGVTVPVSSVKQALERGYKPEAPQAHEERRREEEYGDSPITAGLEGLARGASFGLSDTILKAYQTNYGAPEATRTTGVEERKARNPIAAGIGETAGFIGTSALTGLGGAAGAAGKAAFSGSGLLARAGAAAVRTGLEGSAMGLGQGISDVALSKDPMSAEAIVGQISHRVLVGAGLGAAVGGAATIGAAGLGAAIGKAGAVVRKTADKLRGELIEDSGGALATAEPALRDEVMAMSKPQLEAAKAAEQGALDATRAQDGAALAKDLETFHADISGQLGALQKQIPGNEMLAKAGRAADSLDDVLGDMRGLAEDPQAALAPLRRLEQQVSKLSDVLPEGTVKPTMDRLVALQDRIANLTGDATSPRLEAFEARLEQLTAKPKPTPTIDKATDWAAKSAGGTIGGMIAGPHGAFAGAWLGKELAGTLRPLAKRVLGAVVDHSEGIADGAESIMAKLSAPSPALNALQDFATASGVAGESAYERATKAITQAAANPDQTAAGLQEELAGLAQAAPKLAEQVQQGMLAKVQFLASKVPPQPPMGLTGRMLPPSDFQRSTFARYLAAAGDPLRLLKELKAGMIMPETLETHQALFPATTARLQRALVEQLSDPTVAAKVPYQMRLQLGMLLGPQADPTLDPSFVGLMQQSFAQPPQGGKPPGNRAPEPATSAQRLTSR